MTGRCTLDTLIAPREGKPDAVWIVLANSEGQNDNAVHVIVHYDR